MTAEEEQMINETCQKAADRIEELQAQLSAKDQECEELKSSLSASERFRASDAASALDEQNNLRAENERLKEEILSERAFTWELTSLRDENERLKNIVLSDKETHDRAEYSLRKRCEDLEASLKESNFVLEWHLSKSMPERQSDQSDFFNYTANAISKNKELLSQ